ncbi:MAG: L-serine ammonia-lyase, iron-sulfur-dependent, subunit alpha, partial [Clostridia bacterium]|nr:L-serine ammonia-lyase, iron-sulfur-dependent, subunit alpha [Clostridia bacterium]
MLKYESISELVRAAEEKKTGIGKLALLEQAEAMEKTPLELFEKMQIDLQVMVQAVRTGEEKNQRSMSGLTGGEAYKMNAYVKKTGGGLSGAFLGRAMARALAVAGCNASMGRIVAAPTAGSCGILPGCLVSMMEDRGVPEEDVISAMFTAG